METNLSFSRSRDSEAAFGTQSATMGGSFWMFGATMTETNGHKLLFPESIAKGSSGKSFEHLHFDTYTYTHTLDERKHPSAKYASVKVCKCKYASMICKGEYASTQ